VNVEKHTVIWFASQAQPDAKGQRQQGQDRGCSEFRDIAMESQGFLKVADLNKKTFSGKFGVSPPNPNRGRSRWSVTQLDLFLMHVVCIIIFKGYSMFARNEGDDITFQSF
jgi:hypothetical protein